MSDGRAKELLDLGNTLYTRRDPLLNLWQEIAENFFVERSDFIGELQLGEDLSQDTMDSFPSMLRRELGNSISAMLRPRDRPWFEMSTMDEDRDRDVDNNRYLEYVAAKMKRAIYDPRAKFIRATKEADHDFVTFGQTVLSCEESHNRDHLYFRTFHLRDCVWLENSIGDVDHLHRKDKMTARKMKQVFKENVLHRSVKDACKKDPSKEFNVRCIVMPADEYDYIGKESKSKKSGKKLPFVTIYVDADNCKILKEGGLPDFNYVVPRWHTISGWQYAFSPATVIALPDARMAQMMARIILEAGEKAVDPPYAADSEVVREANLQAGALTWVDLQADRRIQDVIAPLMSGDSNMTVALEMRRDMREMLTKAWFIEKLTLPPASGADQMTAEEIRVRQDEFIRNLLPLFEPMEVEYNSKVLDKAFGLMRNMGNFPPEEVPDDLRGSDVSWTFESPIQVASRRSLVTQFQETLGLIAAGAEAGVSAPVKLDLALKEAIYGVGAPSKWFMSDDEIEAKAEADAQKAAMAQTLMAVQGAAETAGSVADASQKVGQAMLPPPPPPPPKGLPAPRKAA